MTMPKRKAPTTGERFDALLQNLAEATGNDAEIDALHEVATALWKLLTPEQEEAFFDGSGPLERKAARWAGSSDARPSSPRPVGRHAELARACECLLEAFRESGDLNDLPASEVIDMLATALGRRTRGRDGPPPDTGNVATNAARIARAIDPGFDLTPAMLEEVVTAATALDRIEAAPGFIWETQRDNWESVCVRIADRLPGGVKSWPREIRRLLQ